MFYSRLFKISWHWAAHVFASFSVIGFNFWVKLKAERSVYEFYDATERGSLLKRGINELWSFMSLSLDLSDTYFLVYNKELAHDTLLP